jgi:hypothetical protein
MGMMKEYLLAMIMLGSDSQEQEAIEWAIYRGWFQPSYNFQQDKLAIERQLPVLVERFRQEAREHEAIRNAPMQEFIDSVAGVAA